MINKNQNLPVLLKDRTITLFFILSVLYIGLVTPIVRYTYYFLTKNSVIQLDSNNFILNNNGHIKLQEKLILDLPYHKLNFHLFPKTVIKLSLNDEGKITGYRYYSVFYPNYFTHNQAKRVINKDYLINKKKITFHIVKVSYH